MNHEQWPWSLLSCKIVGETLQNTMPTAFKVVAAEFRSWSEEVRHRDLLGPCGHRKWGRKIPSISNEMSGLGLSMTYFLTEPHASGHWFLGRVVPGVCLVHRETRLLCRVHRWNCIQTLVSLSLEIKGPCFSLSGLPRVSKGWLKS